MQFTKMEGLGNDYIYINCLEAFPEELSALAVRLSDRHFGVGGDGLICIGPGREGDFSMHMFNADGSRGMMCGRLLRDLIRKMWSVTSRFWIYCMIFHCADSGDAENRAHGGELWSSLCYTDTGRI